MPHTSHTLFFGWDYPWLPRLATYLLSKWPENEAVRREDLSGTLVVVPGRRAGRRLLELLALQAAEESLILIPPRIVTLREAVLLLLLPPEKQLPEAGLFTSHLAWHEVFRELPEALLQKIQPLSEEVSVSNRGAYLVGLAEQLAQELGGVGLDFKSVAARIGALCPESGEREEERWKALAVAQEYYRTLLASWGTSDANDLLRSCLEKGTPLQTLPRLLIAGVSGNPFLLKGLFEKINASIFVIAPQEHAAGFGPHGELLTSYWLAHPAAVEDHCVVPCERSENQVEEVVRLVSSMDNPAALVSIAVPDSAILPLLQDRLSSLGKKSHWAGGLPFRGGRLYQLLQALVSFLDTKGLPGPSLASVGALLRHPDVSSHCAHAEQFLKRLDALEREHLPAFLEKESLSYFEKNEELLPWIDELEALLKVTSERLPLAEAATQLRALLLRLFGKRQVRGSDPEGHYFLGCLEQCLLLLDEASGLGRIFENPPFEGELKPMARSFSVMELSKNLLEFLTEKKIPEKEEEDAFELLGWLEMAADDAPCALITSCHEGFLPQKQPSNPLLPDSLRKAFGLPDEETLLARDHYFFQSIMASRQTICIAPRYNGRGEPVRPSRLLMAGSSRETLPERVLALTQRAVAGVEEKKEGAAHASQFQERPLGEEVITAVTVTGLRTYLQSPRLFYLRHVLKLQESEEPPLEMHAGHFGTLLHSVLGAFGMEKEIAQEEDAQKITAWLEKKLHKIAHRHFAPGPSFPITLQLEEAAEALRGFALAQVAHRRKGWRIVASENIQQRHARPLEEKFILKDGRSMLLQGRIDRVDWHAGEQRWMIIDYKTLHRQEWKSATPNKEHFQKKGEEFLWKDLQLPLYLKLAPHWEIIKRSGLPLPTLDNTELRYFQLPIEASKACLTEPFDQRMIIPAWHETKRVIAAILDRDFEEIGELDAKKMPTLAALCGIAAIGR